MALAALLLVALSGGTPASAAPSLFWPTSDTDVTGSIPPKPRPLRRSSYPKFTPLPKDLAKPQGPLVITISIEKQHMKVYDGRGLFAETPVSTGTAGHPTPMGVFSIIQRSKWHRSNLYSGAPMPYMQRITWSGVAVHAGILPGYPASHGCIRMPMAFATKLWVWARLGARVIITPGEAEPTDIAHGNLPVRAPPVAISDAAQPASAPVSTPKQDKTLAVAQGDPAGVTEPADAGQTSAPRELIRFADAGPTNARAPSSDASSTSGKDTTRLGDPALPAIAPPGPVPTASITEKPASKRAGHVAVFVSRKENRIYVRQNFEPLFDAPIEIADSNRTMGTHVFTARADGSEADLFRWSAVSLPALPRRTEPPRRDRSGKVIAAPAPMPVVAAVQFSAADALARLTLPDAARSLLASSLAPGSSLVISDQGLGSETGRGTDFIVPLR